MKNKTITCPICEKSREVNIGRYIYNRHNYTRDLIRVIPNRLICEHLLSVYLDPNSLQIKQFEIVQHRRHRTSSIIVDAKEKGQLIQELIQ